MGVYITFFYEIVLQTSISSNSAIKRFSEIYPVAIQEQQILLFMLEVREYLRL